MIQGATGLSHVNVVVRDLDTSKRFYTQTLGLELADEIEVSDPALSTGLGVPDAKLRAGFFRLPGSDAQIEMIEYVSPTAADAENAAANRVGYGHFALTVTDVDAAHAALSEAGVQFVSEPVTVPGDVRFCWLLDPDGNRVELIQYDVPFPSA